MHAQPAIHTDANRRSTLRSVAPVLRRLRTDRIDTEPLDQSMQLMGATMSYPRNTEIFGENEPSDYLYKVVSGSVRTYKILTDGRRQVGGFYLPGDIFGLEFADEHTLSAEAITDTKVLVVKRSTINALAGRDASIASELFALTGRELKRVQDRILLLVKSAQERVASFLLEMAERVSGGNSIELPMSRQDIADYLGLTIETVSRTLTSLEGAAAIEVPTSRRIVLRNRGALARMNG
ncbi:MAG TPA: helix-turn-helix domain-containing protein [Xanthobacteraceae bacterium]|nr:helix-turn-helix domain-containing protein [Xanthobacteraceae bacterium]